MRLPTRLAIVIAVVVVAAFTPWSHAASGHGSAGISTRQTPLLARVSALSTRSQSNAYLRHAHFIGYLYLERHNQVIISQGYGMADAQHKRPNTLHTKWPAFNENRFLLAVAIMKLQEQGKLSVTDRVCRYVSGCPKSWRAFTVEELLLNSTGLAGYNPFARDVTTTGTLKACKATPVLSRLGTAGPWSECNAFLLSTIIMKVTGTSWLGAMRQLVFVPAGMTESGQMTNAFKPPKRGRFYLAGRATPELNYNGTYFAYTSVADLVRLNHALTQGRLLSTQSLTDMLAPRFHDDPNNPNSPLRCYEAIFWAPPSGRNKAVGTSDVNGGGGEDEIGGSAGLDTSVAFSPDDGAMEIFIDNDDGVFDGNHENHFNDLIGQMMWGK